MSMRDTLQVAQAKMIKVLRIVLGGRTRQVQEYEEELEILEKMLAESIVRERVLQNTVTRVGYDINLRARMADGFENITTENSNLNQAVVRLMAQNRALLKTNTEQRLLLECADVSVETAVLYYRSD